MSTLPDTEYKHVQDPALKNNYSILCLISSLQFFPYKRLEATVSNNEILQIKLATSGYIGTITFKLNYNGMSTGSVFCGQFHSRDQRGL